jgi:hypothetical protein
LNQNLNDKNVNELFEEPWIKSGDISFILPLPSRYTEGRWLSAYLTILCLSVELMKYCNRQHQKNYIC